MLHISLSAGSQVYRLKNLKTLKPKNNNHKDSTRFLQKITRLEDERTSQLSLLVPIQVK